LPAWRIPPPLPAKPVIDTYHGVEVVDPYRQLEDLQSPAVQAWLRAQADATAAILARIPGRATLLERMAEIEGAAGGVVGGIVRSPGERLFFLRRDPGEEQFKLVWREGIDGCDTVLVDPDALTRAAGRPWRSWTSRRRRMGGCWPTRSRWAAARSARCT
jgi:prolyl oligopeptidase